MSKIENTISIYNRSQNWFKHRLPDATEHFVLAPQSQGEVPVVIWEIWQKALSKHELSNLLVGGAPKDDNQKLTAAVDALSESEKKLAAKELELNNLQGLLAKMKADQDQSKKK